VISLASPAKLAGAWVLHTGLRLSRRRAGLVLVYHAVAERAGDDRREVIRAHSVKLLEAHLRHLRARYRLVRAEDLPAAVATRTRGARFPVAITFDDDLASHVELAAPLLRRRGVAATFFLTGASLDRPFWFWWQRLQHAVDRGLDVGVEASGIHELARRIEGMSSEARAEIRERLERDLGPAHDDPGLRAGHVRELADAGFDVGFHTLRHDRLTDLDDERLRAAMKDGRAALENAVGRDLRAIAYPHGKADERVAQAAGAAGFDHGFTGRYEPVVPSSDLLLLGRIEPTFGSPADFAFQLVGALLRRAHR